MRKNGITLIALIISIIVMLILVGVAIGSTIDSDGVFSKANETKDEWNERIKHDEEKINEIWGQVGGKEKKFKKTSDDYPGILEGQGTDADPYIINSIEDLVAFAYSVNTNGQYNNQTVLLGLSLDIENDISYANPNTKYVLDNYGYKVSENGTAIKTLLTDTTLAGFVPIGKTNGFLRYF